MLETSWYISMVEDCKAITTETEFTARWALVQGYHELGERILAEIPNFARIEVYGQEIAKRVSESLGKNERTVQKAIQFARKYPRLDQVPGGKSMSWHRVCNELLPAPLEGKPEKLIDAEGCQCICHAKSR